AVLVRNVDEPGLNPYQVMREVPNQTKQCYDGVCWFDITFDKVPAGKRLVVKNVSGDLCILGQVSIMLNAAGKWYFWPVARQPLSTNGCTIGFNVPLLAF